MEVGFDTIGNATLIFYDKTPILATDPWLEGDAYFGSWVLPFAIPEEQLRAIDACKYIWFSHGHPDHLNPTNLPRFKGKKILLPDHEGGRIRKALEQDGFDVTVLPDKKWVSLSERVKIMCFADYNQDAVLLVDIGGRLVFNMNDAYDCGWGRAVKKVISQYSISFMLKGFGEADMSNFYDEEGKPIRPTPQPQLGKYVSRLVDGFGAKLFIPFSAAHAYQRTDSLWTNDYVAEFSDYGEGYQSSVSKILPAFIRYDCSTDTFVELNPARLPVARLSPEHFGDNWSDPLEAADFSKVDKYFRSIEHLGEYLDFVNLKVGAKDNFISLNKEKFKRGITFEVPRNSLMQAVEWEIFDDLLIGNFMKTILHGKWPETQLYPDFSPYVGKYADNGNAKTLSQLDAYFKKYKEKDPLNFLVHRMENHSKNIFRNFISSDSKLYQYSKKIYYGLKK
jgi:hypothetical protein